MNLECTIFVGLVVVGYVVWTSATFVVFALTASAILAVVWYVYKWCSNRTRS